MQTGPFPLERVSGRSWLLIRWNRASLEIGVLERHPVRYRSATGDHLESRCFPPEFPCSVHCRVQRGCSNLLLVSISCLWFCLRMTRIRYFERRGTLPPHRSEDSTEQRGGDVG